MTEHNEMSEMEAIGYAIYAAAKTLPAGWRITIELEKDAGTVDVERPGYEPRHIEAGEKFSEQIYEAIAWAKVQELVGGVQEQEQ